MQVVLILLLLAGAAAAVSNLDPAVCQTYSKLNERVHCGSSGYLIKYGQKYCKRFNSHEYYDRFDNAGKTFAECTTRCLLQKIQEIVEKEETAHHIDCNDITNQAFDSHVDCYLSCDFCSVCATNKLAFFRAYEFKDFLSWNAFKQIIEVMKTCGISACI